MVLISKLGHQNSLHMSKLSGFTFRFCIGSQGGKRSGVWRVWTNDGKSDVYVAVRTIAGLSKISLHETGDCNASMTAQSIAMDSTMLEKLNGTRHLDQWRRPLRTGRLLSIPLRLRFPASELRAGIDSVPEKDLHWIPPPIDGCTCDVVFMFSSSPHEPGDWPWRTTGGICLASTVLANGEKLWLVSKNYTTGQPLASVLDERKPSNLPLGSRLLMGEIGPGNIRIITDAASDKSAPTEA